jgi:hypothetical protein
MFSSLLWGWPFTSIHAKTDTARDRMVKLRGILDVSVLRLEHIANADGSLNPKWIVDQCVERSNATYHVIDQALGPESADAYSKTNAGKTRGVAGIQADVGAKAKFVRSLLADLDSLAIMGDWQP